MGDMYLELLKAFGFKDLHFWIATVSAILFLCSFLGGVLSALMFVNSNALQKRPLKDRISFRMFILGEVMMLIFVFFYHVFMIEQMTVSHIIYWVSALMVMPLMAIIGSQSIQVAFSSRMKLKEDALKRQHQAVRAKRAQELESKATPAGPAKPSNLAARAMAARKAKRP